MNSTEDLFFEIYSFLKEKFDISDEILKYISLQLPHSFNDLYMVPSFGPSTLKEKGQQIIDIINAFVEKNQLEYNTLEEAFELFFLPNKKSKLSICIDRISEFATIASSYIGMQNSLNSKHIYSYLAYCGFVELEFGNIKNVTGRGKEYGLEILDNKGSNYFKYGHKISKYLCENIYNIYAFAFGRSPFSYLYDSVEEILEEHQNQTKYFFIFDMDQTIVDTDGFRERRRKLDFHVTDEELKNIKFIEGFEGLFLDENSKFSLYKNDAIIVTNSSKYYAKRILDKKREQYDALAKVWAYQPSEGKIDFIKKYIKEHDLNPENIIAFGDDEKDALIYSICGVPYYIVSNYYGYDAEKNLMEKVIVPKNEDFRKTFLYDIIKISPSDMLKNIESKYYDDIIVYYRRYYDKKNYVDDISSPEFDNRHFLKKLTYFSFGENKALYLQAHAHELVFTDYKDLSVNPNTVFAKVPGSKEIAYDENLPCSLLIEELSKRFGKKRNYADCLIRNKKVQTSHGGGTRLSSKEHYDSMYVTKNIKGKEVYLFDDVITTGTQMMACVERLYEAGASHVVCFAIAKTCPTSTPITDIYGTRRYK